MSYYLSDANDKILQPYIRILEKSVGEISLPATSPSVLIGIIRNAANTKYPNLKRWRFKQKHDHVLAIPKDPTLIVPIIHKENVDYIGIISILINDKPELIHFTDFDLWDTEFEKLITFCEKQEYKIEKTDNLLIISK